MVIISNSQQLLQSIGNGDSLALNGSNQLTKMSGFQKFIQGFCDIFTSQKNIQARQTRVQNAMVSMLVDARLETMGIRPQGPVNLEKPQSQSKEIQTAIQDAQYAINSTRLQAEAFKLTQNPTQAKILMSMYMSGLNDQTNAHLTSEIKEIIAKKDPSSFSHELKPYVANVKSDAGQKLAERVTQPIDTKKWAGEMASELKYCFDSKSNHSITFLENGINTSMKRDLDRAPYRINGTMPHGINGKGIIEDGMKKMVELCPNINERKIVSLFANQNSSLAFFGSLENIADLHQGDRLASDFIQDIPTYDIYRNQDKDIVIKINNDIKYVNMNDDVDKNVINFAISMGKHTATITIPHAQFENFAEGTIPAFDVKVE